MLATQLAGENGRLTAQQERAARLIADDTLTRAAIAKRLRIGETTLYRWQAEEPAFRARVQQLREEFRAQAMQDAAFADKRLRVVARNGIALDLLRQLQASDYKTVVGLTEEGEPIEGFDKERLRLFDTYLNSIAEEMGDRGGKSAGTNVSVSVGIAVALAPDERVGRLAGLLARLDARGD